MRIRGSTSHWDEDVLAGQRKTPSGNEGARTTVSGRGRDASLTGEEAAEDEPPAAAAGFLPLRRGLWGDEFGVAMLGMAAWTVLRSSRLHLSRSGEIVWSAWLVDSRP
jgi:hypothetical protein